MYGGLSGHARFRDISITNFDFTPALNPDPICTLRLHLISTPRLLSISMRFNRLVVNRLRHVFGRNKTLLIRNLEFIHLYIPGITRCQDLDNSTLFESLIFARLFTFTPFRSFLWLVLRDDVFSTPLPPPFFLFHTIKRRPARPNPIGVLSDVLQTYFIHTIFSLFFILLCFILSSRNSGVSS
jgi:hypothetical protein